ncbi:Uncharacterised protein [Klebsiella pneumoniae]|uniref:Uncharacterized protein n=1 Tax=Klebsiella pneumoniae TaxID=573 RepID=A0A2X3EKI4_KLEPN|nr:Uncharacterised protein [Klebsiella pneumoniae]
MLRKRLRTWTLDTTSSTGTVRTSLPFLAFGGFSKFGQAFLNCSMPSLSPPSLIVLPTPPQLLWPRHVHSEAPRQGCHQFVAVSSGGRCIILFSNNRSGNCVLQRLEGFVVIDRAVHVVDHDAQDLQILVVRLAHTNNRVQETFLRRPQRSQRALLDMPHG